MNERTYEVIFSDNSETVATATTGVTYDVYDSTLLNVKAIAQAVQTLLYDALKQHDWELVSIAELALESVESVNYRVYRDFTSSINTAVIIVYLD